MISGFKLIDWVHAIQSDMKKTGLRFVSCGKLNQGCSQQVLIINSSPFTGISRTHKVTSSQLA